MEGKGVGKRVRGRRRGEMAKLPTAACFKQNEIHAGNRSGARDKNSNNIKGTVQRDFWPPVRYIKVKVRLRKLYRQMSDVVYRKKQNIRTRFTWFTCFFFVLLHLQALPCISRKRIGQDSNPRL